MAWAGLRRRLPGALCFLDRLCHLLTILAKCSQYLSPGLRFWTLFKKALQPAFLGMALPGVGRASRVGSPSMGVPAWTVASSRVAVPLRRAAPSATQITVVLPHSSSKTLYLGTESGSVFVVQVPGFRMLEDRTISSDAVLQR